MASIQPVNGKWRAQVAIKGVRRSAMWDTKREAQQWADRVEREIEAGMTADKSLGQAVALYKKTVSPTKRHPKWEGHRLDAFLLELGADTPLVDINASTIAKWRDKRLQTVVGATVQRESNLLRNLFTKARDEWQWITHHPFKGVKLPPQSESRHQVWKWQDIKRVLRAERTGKTAEVVLAFHIALHTALRLSEVLSGVYDAKRRVIVLDRTKTTGRVEVPVTRRAAKLLPAAFTVGPNEASTLFSKLTRQLLIEDLTFHDTRATALTLMARRMDVMTLARISRHRDLKTLLNTYYRESAEQISARL